MSRLFTSENLSRTTIRIFVEEHCKIKREVRIYLQSANRKRRFARVSLLRAQPVRSLATDNAGQDPPRTFMYDLIFTLASMVIVMSGQQVVKMWMSELKPEKRAALCFSRRCQRESLIKSITNYRFTITTTLSYIIGKLISTVLRAIF